MDQDPRAHPVKFFADPDVLAIVQRESNRGRGNLSRLINDAVRRYNNPPFRIVFPTADYDTDVSALLDRAQSIDMFDLTLRSLPYRYAHVLESCTRHGVRMRF